MNLAQRWENEQCYYVMGFAYPDGTFIAVTEKNAGELLFTTKHLDFEKEQVNWTNATTVCKAVSNEYIVYGGETGYEGYGFIAVELKHDHKLLWTFFHTHEAVVDITINNARIQCTSGEYPTRYHWSIPINDPTHTHYTEEALI